MTKRQIFSLFCYIPIANVAFQLMCAPVTGYSRWRLNGLGVLCAIAVLALTLVQSFVSDASRSKPRRSGRDDQPPRDPEAPVPSPLLRN
jgi:hypothetical protein